MTTVKPNLAMVEMHDNIPLQVARFEPETAPLGVVQLIHGFGEHIGLYKELGEFFARNGYACVIHDQRGFGEMPDKTRKQQKAGMGITPGYDCFLLDLETVRRKIGDWYPGLRVTLYGHSMGGNIVLNYLLRHPTGVDKAILETPWLRLCDPPPGIVIAIAKLGGRISPKLAIVNQLNYNDITRDPEKVELLNTDEYYHNRISLRMFSQITEAGEYALENAARITTPTLLLHAGDDRIVDPRSALEFFEKTGDAVIKEEYPEGYHSLHSDTIRAEVFERMLAFCGA